MNTEIDVRHERIRDQVLDAFEARCSESGPRAVSMASLVAQLGISTKTLYRLYASKNDILVALMQRWAHGSALRQQEGLATGLAPQQRITDAALVWLQTHSRFSAQFWRELARDFPDAQSVYAQEYQAFLQRSRSNLIGDIREDLKPDLALSCLMALIRHATEPAVHTAVKLDRAEALVQAIDLWSVGALRSSSVSALS
ncbi:MAG: TetR/AcrR family transcriptional regulator [Halioglobus sp.]